MMLLAPLLLAGAIGAAFGSGNNFSIAAVKTVVVDQDRGARRRGGPDGAAAGATAASRSRPRSPARTWPTC